jgi:hypothetical protein
VTAKDGSTLHAETFADDSLAWVRHGEIVRKIEANRQIELLSA